VDNGTAQCNICSTRYKTYLGCTSALKNHLKNAHKVHVPNVKETKGIQIRNLNLIHIIYKNGYILYSSPTLSNRISENFGSGDILSKLIQI